MPRPRPGRLFLRIALTLGGSLTLAFAMAAALSIWIGTRALGRSVEEEMRGVADIVHLDLERFLAARRAELQLCSAVEAMDDVVLGDNHFRIQNELMRLARTYPDIYDELAVLKLDGEVVASTRVERIGTLLPVDGLGLLAGPEGSRIGAGPQQVAAAPQPVWAMVRPVQSSLSHAQAGWLMALVRWSAVSEVVQGTSVVGRNQSPDAFMILMRGDQPIAGHGEWLPGRLAHDRRHLIRSQAVRHGNPQHNTGNERSVEITSGPRPADWHVVFFRDASQAFAPVRLFAWSVLAAGIIGLLVAAALSLRAAGDFTRRVETLRLGTQRLAAGDYAHRVIDARDDELAQLGDAFNSMAEATQAARQTIEQSNAELEDSNRRLLEASKLKDEFLANTSHELRTPLNGILGFLGLVNDGLCDSPEEERQSVRVALECGQHLRVLIEDVLDVSRIEAGRLILSMQTLPVAPALELQVAEMSVRARARGLELICEPLADPALAVRADAQRLQQVLRLLLDNAIKFTERGSITLACVAPEGAGYVRFDVRDTGIGIPLDRQAQVFERFVQGDGSATRRFGGTGLGLSLVRDLVEMMGGVVRLTSGGAGRGTTVSFTLPPGWAGPESDGRDGPAAGADERVLGPAAGPLALVVEDDRALTTWLRAVLHADGIRTAVADSAERAWMMLRRLRPSVVVLDHALPAGPMARFRTGAQLARHMAENRATADIPVVLLTGHDPVALEGAGALPKAVRFMRKPVRREELLFELWRTITTHKPRAVNVMLAHRDPRLLALAGRLAPAAQFIVSLERNDESCLEALRLRPRTFDVVLLEAPASLAEAAALLQGFAALEAPPPIVVIAEPAMVADPSTAKKLCEWPVFELFSMLDALAQPETLRERLLALGGAAALPDDDAPERVA